ncbi:MAG: phosphate transport system permease protein [Clostridia bacterium]|jgi:phosphate transport system permease protein|nr:phosphate transport system permease protein [Clostridia bacterium]MDN5323885.1 phosphate transport system permease protein [Clostridia bacterium]
MDRINKKLGYIDRKELVIKRILQLFALISILTTIGIVITLFKEALVFLQEVSIVEFLTGKIWAPLLEPRHFGILPLVTGTMLIAVCSSIISLPLGLATAIYLSEYAPSRARKIIKPMLEILAGIPSVVYGYFALTFITPVLQKIYPGTEVFNAASASIALGIMILPMVASLSEDAMMAIPDSIRNGAYALGSTKFEVATKIVVPASISGIVSAFVLAVSRAIGETMVVAIAAGASPKLTFNPFESVQTMTGYMVNVALGDIQHGTIMYKTVFAVGAVLFIITFIMNIIAKLIVKKVGEAY